jgi:hypothetical protein
VSFQRARAVFSLVPDWVPDRMKDAVDSWILAAGINSGSLLRSITKADIIWGYGSTPKFIRAIVKLSGTSCGLPTVSLHDLRRTSPRPCYQTCGELERINFCWVASPFRRRSDTWSARSVSKMQLRSPRPGNGCVLLSGVRRRIANAGQLRVTNRVAVCASV